MVCYRSAYLPTLQRALQSTLNKLQTWADTNGFHFSRTKTVAVHFCRLRLPHPDPDLFLGDTPIQFVNQTKFLGVIFDKKLSFLPHIRNLKIESHKALNILKVVGHYNWGADRRTLLSLYRSLVRSKLDYGSIVYGTARHSYRKLLDPIQNQALRICLGAFRTSPADSLCVEANEMPLERRRQQLAGQYIIKIKSYSDNPAYDSLFNLECPTLYENTNSIRPSGFYMKAFLEDMEEYQDLDLSTIQQFSVAPFPPWEYVPPVIDLSLTSDHKKLTSPHVLKLKFMALHHDQYSDRVAVYTDGSKADNKVGAAAITNKKFFVRRLPNGCSVFSAELVALGLALQYISASKHTRFVVYSDSLSALQSLSGDCLRNPLLQDVIQNYIYTNREQKKNIVFCWVPGHVGITGTELADFAAKAALNDTIADMQVPYTDYIPYVRSYVRAEWQQWWNIVGTNKLSEVKPILGDWTSAYRTSRREEIILSRLRIGHTYVTHSHLLKGQPRPVCAHCNESLTVNHFLIDCPSLHGVRTRFYRSSTILELFQKTDPNHIFLFLKSIGLYYKI